MSQLLQNPTTRRIHVIIYNWSQASKTSKAFFSLSLLNLLLQVTFISSTLYTTWNLSCQEPFRLFLLAHVIQSAIAISFDIYLYFGYSTHHEEDGRSGSFVYFLKRILNLFAFIIFLYGNYYLFFDSVITCDLTAPTIYNLSYIIVICEYILYATPILFSIISFLFMPCLTFLSNIIRIKRNKLGISQKEISTLPIYQLSTKEKEEEERWSSTNTIPIIYIPNDQDRLCVICLSTYEKNDILCKLWCEHHFHRECIFEWLKLNAVCPLCKRDCRKGGGENKEEHQHTMNIPV